MTPAELWQKLLRIASVHGSAGYSDSTPYYHLGIDFGQREPGDCDQYSVDCLKKLVNYSEKMNTESADKAAWISLMNAEEVRAVGGNGFAITSTYSGHGGLLSERHESHLAHNKLQKLVMEYVE